MFAVKKYLKTLSKIYKAGDIKQTGDGPIPFFSVLLPLPGLINYLPSFSKFIFYNNILRPVGSKPDRIWSYSRLLGMSQIHSITCRWQYWVPGWPQADCLRRYNEHRPKPWYYFYHVDIFIHQYFYLGGKYDSEEYFLRPSTVIACSFFFSTKKLFQMWIDDR